MKLTFSYLLALAALVLANCLSVPVAAQEIPGYELGDPQYQQGGSYEIDDKPLIYEPEGSTKVYRQRDTTAVTRPVIATKKPATSRSGSGKLKEEDPLSFNFLYYIIQKFKSTDILEP